MENMSGWIDVLKTPLGFGGFALFLIFSVLSRVVKKEKHKTITLVVFLGMAVVSLIGGLILAREQVKQQLTPILTVESGDGGVSITGNSGVVKVGTIDTKVQANGGQSKNTGKGSVTIENNNGNVQVGKIKTEVGK